MWLEWSTPKPLKGPCHPNRPQDATARPRPLQPARTQASRRAECASRRQRAHLSSGPDRAFLRRHRRLPRVHRDSQRHGWDIRRCRSRQTPEGGASRKSARPPSRIRSKTIDRHASKKSTRQENRTLGKSSANPDFRPWGGESRGETRTHHLYRLNSLGRTRVARPFCRGAVYAADPILRV